MKRLQLLFKPTFWVIDQQRRRLFGWGLLCLWSIGLSAGVNPDLEVHARFAAPTALESSIEYLDVELRNADPDQVSTGVSVQIIVPAGLTVLRAEDEGAGTYTAGTWTVPSLPPNTSTHLRLALHADAAGTHDVLAQVTAADQPDTDSTPNNDTGNQSEDDESRARLVVGNGCTPATSDFQVITSCNDNGTTDPTDDYYTFTTRSVSTSGTLEIIGPGGYESLAIAAGATNTYSRQIPVGYTMDFYFTDGGGCHYKRQVSPASCSNVQVCYAMGNTTDRTYVYNETTNVWTLLTGSSGGQTQGIEYNPFNDTLYAANDQNIGHIQTGSGQYQVITTPGNADGSAGNIDIQDWHSMSYDPYTGNIWLVMQRGGNDLLMVFNPAAENVAYDYFGDGVDYLELDPVVLTSPAVTLADVDDIVYHPVERILYATVHDGSAGNSRLVTYDPATGALIEVISDYGGIEDVAGIALTSRGTLVATTGRDAAAGTNNRFYDLILPTGELIDRGQINPSSPDVDPEGITCLTADPMTISGRLYNDTNQDDFADVGETGRANITVALYYDVDQDGRVDPGTDHLMSTTTSDAGGNYSFQTVVPGPYVVQPAPGGIPPGGAPTYPATRTAVGAYAPSGVIDDVDFGIGQGVDLELWADWEFATATTGDVLDLTLTLTNRHPSLATTGVTVTDLLPANLTLLGNDPSTGQYNAATKTWTVGTMGGGQTETLRFTVQVDVESTHTYTAQVATQSGDDIDSAPGNDTGYQLEDDETAAVLTAPNSCSPAGNLLVVDPFCNDNGTADVTDDYYTMTAIVGGTVGTDYTLSYFGGGQSNTIGVTAGQSYNLSLPIPIGERTGFTLTQIGGAGNCYTHQITSPGGCSEAIKCFAVADNLDVLFEYNSATDTWTEVGSLGVGSVEAIAYDYIRDTLYTLNNEVFGWVNQTNGNFTALSTAIGIIEGVEGPHDVISVDGLAYDHVADVFWAVERRDNLTTAKDYIFQIDRKTGQPVYDAFGPGVDYIAAQPAQDPTNNNFLYDIDDLAFDPATGDLYGIANQGGNGDVLVTYDKTNGNILRTVSAFNGVSDMEGLSFFNNNTIAGTTGNSSADPLDDDRFYKISTYTGNTIQLNRIDPTSTNQDFEASDCLTGQPNTISGTFFLDSSEDGVYQGGESGDAGVPIELYFDFDGDGKIDPAIDQLVQTVTTDAFGNYSFDVASTGSFLVAPQAAGIPGGGRAYTTEDLQAVDFYTMGNTDPGNDFGSVNGCVFDTAVVQDVTCDKGADSGSADDDRMVITFVATATAGTGTFNIGISSGSVSPTTGTYGVPVTVTTEPGSAGKGNVILYLSDASKSACTFDLYVTDPGDCPCPQICLPVEITRM